jgi:hypothetical protein
MMRLAGWRTATMRSKGNHSSRWRYNNGASARANTAPLSVASTAEGTTTGTGGMCACGPHAAVLARARPTETRQKSDKVLPWLVLEK